jgi:hypothetical protein
MYTFIVYFFTVVNNGTAYVVNTIQVSGEKECVSIVKMVNSQPTAGGKNVRAACHISETRK